MKIVSQKDNLNLKDIPDRGKTNIMLTFSCPYKNHNFNGAKTELFHLTVIYLVYNYTINL